jgi:hypothetical protein
MIPCTNLLSCLYVVTGSLFFHSSLILEQGIIEGQMAGLKGAQGQG